MLAWDELLRFPVLEEDQVVNIRCADELFEAGEISIPAARVFKHCLNSAGSPQWFDLRGLNAGAGQIELHFQNPTIPDTLRAEIVNESMVEAANESTRRETRWATVRARATTMMHVRDHICKDA